MTDLNELLRSTETIGSVALFKGERGWSAKIQLPAPVGCEAIVRSEFNCPTPLAAVTQMLDRLTELRRGLNSSARLEGGK